LTTQLCPSRGSNSFASMPKSEQAWPSMVVALCNIRSEQAAPPVAVWQLVATCAESAHWARRRCRVLVFCISQFERFDSRCASTRFDQFEVFVSACYHTLHVHLLTRLAGSAGRNSYTWSVPYRWSNVGRFTPVLLLSGGEHPGARGGKRFASARHSCCITHTRTQLLGRTCNALWCVAEAYSARNTVSVTCCLRMPQQVRRSYARSKELTAGPPGGTPGRSACACTDMHL
jgi:hypothetical protein